ncbi:MAG TPA: transcription elongation factor GreB [Burkholderiaceae bacterium]|nr:transcription elongation factor GreB [Burkholderiaceae bacterium]
MSKAFVRDDGEQDDDGDEPDATPLGAGGQPLTRNYMTPAAHRRMKRELLELIDVTRPEVVRTVSWAASNGDRSENGDYIYGKRRLREIDRRIRFLTKRLDIAEVVDPASREATDQIFFGATVIYERNGTQRETVAIVGIDEADATRGRISWISPMARALIKAREGDTVTVRTPAGVDEIDILEVRYQSLDD